MDLVISVGAGRNQVPLILSLNQRGYRVVGFDLDPFAPGKELCSYFFSISTWDHEKAINWLSKLGLSFKGVGCFSYGKALVTQQKIAHFFNLPCNIPERIVELTSDKKKLRTELKNKKMSQVVEFYYDPNNFDQKIFLKDNTTYIVKPISGGSSKDIVRKKTVELMDYLKLKEDNYLIIQEFLGGDEYRIAALVQESEVKFTSLMYKENLEGTFCTGRLLHLIPTEKWAKNFLFKLISTFNLTDAVLKIDLIKSGEKIEIIEIDFGNAGDYFETNIAKSCYGYDYLNNYINLILGCPVSSEFKGGKYKCFDYIYNLSEKTYKISYTKISENLKKYFGSFEIIKTQRDGALVTYPESNLDNIFGILHDRTDMSNYELNVLVNRLLHE